MTPDEIAGIAIAGITLASAGVGTWLRLADWRRRTPPLEHRGVRYRYMGVAAWPDLELALDAAIAVCPEICARLWVTITSGPVDTPTTPGGRQPDGREVRGALWAERLWPWSPTTWLVTLKSDARIPTAASSALWSEVGARAAQIAAGAKGRGEEQHHTKTANELTARMKRHYAEGV